MKFPANNARRNLRLKYWRRPGAKQNTNFKPETLRILKTYVHGTATKELVNVDYYEPIASFIYTASQIYTNYCSCTFKT